MEKGYYLLNTLPLFVSTMVAIHNKNGKGLLHIIIETRRMGFGRSQSTIKMEKGYYQIIYYG